MIKWVLAFLCLLTSLHTFARDSVVGMSERVFKAMNEVQELIDANQWSEARESLNALLQRKLSSYETAHTLNMIAYTWYEQNEVAKARTAYEQALHQQKIPESMVTNLLLTLGQVCLVEEDYDAAEEYLLRLLQMPDQSLPSNKVLLANAYMGKQMYTKALAPLQQAIAAERAQKSKPRENWLSMLASVHYELNDLKAMRDTVAELTTLYPRESYLMNLAALHGQLGDTDRQLALVESLLDENRLTKSNHLRMVASLFMAQDLPYKAAMLLEKELASGRLPEEESILEMLSQSWYAAAESSKAIPPLEQAAELAEDGELYLRVARLYMDVYQWDAAEAAAEAALEKGGLRQEGHAWLLRGMALVRMKKLTESEVPFRRAKKFEYTEKYAEQWLTYVAMESGKQNASPAVM